MSPVFGPVPNVMNRRVTLVALGSLITVIIIAQSAWVNKELTDCSTSGLGSGSSISAGRRLNRVTVEFGTAGHRVAIERALTPSAGHIQNASTLAGSTSCCISSQPWNSMPSWVIPQPLLARLNAGFVAGDTCPTNTTRLFIAVISTCCAEKVSNSI